VSAYVDSGILIKLYVREPNSPAAARALRPIPSIPITPLHELEIRNTFRALEGRGTISSSQRAACEHIFERDISMNRLRRVNPDWSDVFAKAIRLSAEHTASTLARSLDILHVAIAITQQADTFLTGDSRQELVARNAQLRVKLIP
jgi:predicted nucleic acid-binding protein